MSHVVRWRTLASDDLHRVLTWYQHEAPEQMSRLAQFISEAETLISSNPLAFRPLEDDVRSYSLPTFPYALWYRPLQSRTVVEILAFVHEAQGPATYEERLGQHL